MTTRTFAPAPPYTRAHSGKPGPQNTDSLPWSSFGTLSAAFTPSAESTVARMQEKARECAGRDTVGSAAERTRSRAVAAAYTRTAALLEELETLRLQALEKYATARNGAR